MYKKLILVSALLSAVAFQANAQSAEGLNDRWEISGSYFRPDLSVEGRANLTATDGTESVSASERARVSDRVDGAKLEASYRLTPRQRLVAGWYGVGKDRAWGISEVGSLENPDDGSVLDYDLAGRAKLDSHFELYNLSYGYDLLQSDKLTLTGLVGVYGAKLDVRGSTRGAGVVDGQDVEWDESARFRRTRHAPGVGLALGYRPADRWDLRAKVQGFKTNWGDFDTDGHFTHASAEVGYRFTPTWSGFVGYDWFELKLKDGVSAAGEVDGQAYAISGPVSATLKVHGPTVGVRARF